MRLIDADALRDALGITGTADSCKGCKYNDRFEFACNTDAAPTFEYVCEMIDDAPTIEERKTGKWIPFEFGDDTWHKCTACGVADNYISIVQRPNGKTGRLKSVRNFCPNCGAKMEGEQP